MITNSNSDKVVVLDMDETIGYFSQLYILWNLLIDISKTRLSSLDFYSLTNIFKCYLHPEIINIITYLRNHNIKTVIFTNNNGPYWWPTLIAKYLNYESSKKIHQQKSHIKEVIRAYKIDGRVNDRRRTSNFKLYSDLAKILNLTNMNKVLFLDDQYHEHMIRKNVTYIKVPKYIMMLPSNMIANMFLQSNYGKLFIKKNNINIQQFIIKVFILMKNNNYRLSKPIQLFQFINLTKKIKEFVIN